MRNMCIVHGAHTCQIRQKSSNRSGVFSEFQLHNYQQLKNIFMANGFLDIFKLEIKRAIIRENNSNFDRRVWKECLTNQIQHQKQKHRQILQNTEWKYGCNTEIFQIFQIENKNEENRFVIAHVFHGSGHRTRNGFQF